MSPGTELSNAVAVRSRRYARICQTCSSGRYEGGISLAFSLGTVAPTATFEEKPPARRNGLRLPGNRVLDILLLRGLCHCRPDAQERAGSDVHCKMAKEPHPNCITGLVALL